MVKALPKGGKCMGFVGFLGADNAVERIDGFKQAIKGHNIELVDVRGESMRLCRPQASSARSLSWRSMRIR